MKTGTTSLARIVDEYPSLAFFALTIAFSWTAWILTFSVAEPRSGVGMIGIIVGAFGPGVAGATMVRLRGESVRSWLRSILSPRRGLRWYGLAAAVPVAGTVGVAVIVFSVAGVPSIDTFAQIAPLFAFNAVLATAFTGGNEEIGWRGFALPHLQTRFNALKASVILGCVWAFWHIPMFVYGVYSMSPVLYSVSVVSFSIILTSYYNSSDGFVLGAVLLHGMINATVNVPGQAIGGVDTVQIPYAGILAVVFGSFALAVVIRYGGETLCRSDVVRPRWTAEEPADESVRSLDGLHRTNPSE